MNRREAVRERLLDATADILESQGIRQLNSNALATAAGVTPPTVYRHFANKEEAVAALARRFIASEQDWLASATGEIGPDTPLEESMRILIDAYWSAARKQRGIVALRGAMRVWPELREVEEESLNSSSRRVAELLSTHGYRGDREPDLTSPNTQIRRSARYIVETVCATVDRCYHLAPREQEWRIAELKTLITRYVLSLQGNG